MNPARNTILRAIASRRGAVRPVPAYALPAWTGDTVSHFIAKARASVAEVHELASAEDVPSAIWAIMAAAQSIPRLHIPEGSPLRALPWERAPRLAVSSASPSGGDCALSAADLGIAETGTLVFFSGPRTPSSWHFRPGCEFALVARSSILPRLEDVIARLAAKGGMPATLNLVTGPSRTADIEQTIELGAHGPRDVHILLTG